MFSNKTKVISMKFGQLKVSSKDCVKIEYDYLDIYLICYYYMFCYVIFVIFYVGVIFNFVNMLGLKNILTTQFQFLNIICMIFCFAT